MKRNNATWVCNQIEEKVEKWKEEISKSRTIPHYEDSDAEESRINALEDVVLELEHILYEDG